MRFINSLFVAVVLSTTGCAVGFESEGDYEVGQAEQSLTSGDVLCASATSGWMSVDGANRIMLTIWDDDAQTEFLGTVSATFDFDKMSVEGQYVLGPVIGVVRGRLLAVTASHWVVSLEFEYGNGQTLSWGSDFSIDKLKAHKTVNLLGEIGCPPKQAAVPGTEPSPDGTVIIEEPPQNGPQPEPVPVAERETDSND